MSVIVITEEAAKKRRGVQSVEVAATGLLVPSRLSMAMNSKAYLGEAVSADFGEGAVARTQVAIDGKGFCDPAVLVVLDKGELAGLWDGAGAEEECVDDAEDDDIRGDAEGEREDGDGGEAWIRRKPRRP
jgi:hypothetical protein